MIQIPTLTDGTVTYEQRTELDGTEYLLSFQWNPRRDKWALSINALDGTDVLTGQNVCLNIPLNRRAVGGPPGVLICLPAAEGDFEPPGLVDFGTRVALWYLNAADLELGVDAIAAGEAPK